MESLARQAPLKLELPLGVAVIGCGGVGSWVAQFLAMAGVENLWLFDFDTVSESNLNRLPVAHNSVGKKKTKAVADAIRKMKPNCSIAELGRFSPAVADSLNLQKEISWVVVTTDTLLSRKEAYRWCHTSCICYIEASAEGETGGVTGEPAQFFTPEENLPGYASVPVWVGPCVMAASVAVAHVLHNQVARDYTYRMGWGKHRFEMSTLGGA